MVSKLVSAMVIGAALAGCAKQPTISNSKNQPPQQAQPDINIEQSASTLSGVIEPQAAKAVINIEQSTPTPNGVFESFVKIRDAEKILSQIIGTDKYAVIFANGLSLNQPGPQIFAGKIEKVAIEDGFLYVKFKDLNDLVLSSYEESVASNDKSYDSLDKGKIERNKFLLNVQIETFEDHPFSESVMSPFRSITHIAIVSAE